MAGVEGGGDAAAVPPFPGLSADGPIHVPPREIRALELVDMVCAMVPPQRVGGLIKSLSSCAPFGNEFKHLKRVRRATSEGDQGAQHHLEVLVCSRVPDESAGWGGHCGPRRDGGAEAEPAHDDIPERVRAALAASGVDLASLAVVRVPRHPPEERDQLDAWNAMWPVSYRILPGTTATKTARLVVSEAEASAMRQHIARAWDSVSCATCRRAPSIAAVAHALLTSPRALPGARQPQRWPHLQRRRPGRPRTGRGRRMRGRRPPCIVRFGRTTQRLLAPPPKARYHAGHRCRGPGSARRHESSCQTRVRRRLPIPRTPHTRPVPLHGLRMLRAAGTLHHVRHGARPQVSQPQHPLLPLPRTPDRCTAADANECATMLTNSVPGVCDDGGRTAPSRVRRIVYCLADKEGGALGGMHRLHGLRSLNHHYEVFHWPLADR